MLPRFSVRRAFSADSLHPSLPDPPPQGRVATPPHQSNDDAFKDIAMTSDLDGSGLFGFWLKAPVYDGLRPGGEAELDAMARVHAFSTGSWNAPRSTTCRTC